MIRKLLFLAAATSLAATAAAATDVATFLRRAEALEKMGMRAAFSDDGRLLMSELNSSIQALREERLAAQAAGRRPAYCPDPNDRASPTEIVSALRTIPPGRRAQVRLTDALRAFYARRYPCAG